MRTRKGSILALVAAGGLLIFGSGVDAQTMTGTSPIPTLENLQTGLLEMISRLHLTHAQHEQVERIIANETMQLALTRGNPNLSVAKIFGQEHTIRIQTRKQIASILTARQTEKVAKWMIHEMEEHERWGEDHTSFFSIPATYGSFEGYFPSGIAERIPVDFAPQFVGPGTLRISIGSDGRLGDITGRPISMDESFDVGQDAGTLVNRGVRCDDIGPIHWKVDFEFGPEYLISAQRASIQGLQSVPRDA